MSSPRDYWSTPSISPRSSGLLSNLPPVTMWMLKANVAVYLVFTLGNLFRSTLMARLYVVLALSHVGIQNGLLWEPFTYMFLHGGFIHILFNMMTLFFLGPETERAMGSKHFLAMYLLSGLLGGLGWLWLSADARSICVGASGAIFGVLGAFATLYPRRQLTILILFFPLTAAAWKIVVGISLLQFLLITGGAAGNIAYAAHVFGAFAGFLYVDRLYESTLLRRTWAGLRARISKRPTQKPKATPPDQAEVDRILDKITRNGIQSLTRAERQVLHRASRTF
jgi:membrane associated rhomboid family serine protease